MDKEKFIKGGIWISVFLISIILASLALYIGFNNQRHGDNTILIIAFMLLPIVFYCAYMGFKLIFQSIFE
tara:strand:+ start:89 stop:298 length:210 start_codon:yes stop_codon:yes gene_type:complete